MNRIIRSDFFTLSSSAFIFFLGFVLLRMAKLEVKKIVQTHYDEIAKSTTKKCCCSSQANENIAMMIGYSNADIQSVPEANLGLGCGNPTGSSKIRPGDTVLDLGSGAGFDCFLAAKKTGKNGRVIGIDMTPSMIQKATENAAKYQFSNVEFRLGDIEQLPVEDASVDVIISNCVINLAPDKKKVFAEAFRVLRSGGRMYVSDIVLLAELSAAQRKNPLLLAGCVAGALLKKDYLKIIQDAGFKINILSENKEISKQQYQGIPLESIQIEAIAQTKVKA